MTDVILFHHAQGLTPGVVAFADELRAAGHRIEVPDLYGGRTLATVEEGVAHAGSIGFDNLIAAGVAAADKLPADIVYGGFSLGALPAQKLAQTRPGALGALLYHGDVPVTAFGDSWPAGVDVQLHTNEADEWCDLDVMRDMVEGVEAVATAELFVYPGSSHLFTDSSLDAYEPGSAALVIERTLEFLERKGSSSRH